MVLFGRGGDFMNFHEILKVKKGLPAENLHSLLFARKLAGNSEIFQEETATGYPCILENSAGKPIINYKIYGNSVQNGTPSPDNPVEVQSVGTLITEGENSGKYEITVVCRGKNLFNKNGLFLDGYLKFDGEISGGNDWKTTNYYIKCSGTVTVSTPHGLGTNPYLVCYDIDKNFLGAVLSGGGTLQEKTVNLLPETYFIKISCRTIALNSYQLEIGENATEYEPYKEPVRTSIILDEPLRKISDYSDFIDFKNNKIVRNIGVKSFYGTEPLIKGNYPVANSNQFYLSRWADLDQNAKVDATLNTHFVNKKVENGTDIGVYYNFYPALNFLPKNADVNDFQAFLDTENAKGTPVTVYYPLAEPTEEIVKLPEIPTFSGTTIIETATEILPSDIEITYKTRGKNL